MSANSKETADAILALSNALGNHHISMKVPSAPPAGDDSDSTHSHSSSHNSDDLHVHEWELGKAEILRRAEAGDTSCKFLAGIGFAKGHFGFPYDIKEANKWLSDAKTYVADRPKADRMAFHTAKGYCKQYALANVKEKNPEEAMEEYRFGDREYMPATFLYAVARYETKQFDEPQYDKFCVRLRATGLASSIMGYPEYRVSIITSIMKDIQACVEAGFTPAYIFLARRHWDGWKDFGEGYGGNEHKNASEALKLLQEAEKVGDSPARHTLSQVYCYGWHGAEKNIPEAQRLLELTVRDNLPAAEEYLKKFFKDTGVVNTPTMPTTLTALPTTDASTSATKLTVVAPPPPVVFSTVVNNNVSLQSQNQQKKKKKAGGCVLI